MNILVIDWLDVYAGSEKVAEYLDQIYQFDKVYTLVNNMPDEYLNKIFNNRKVEIKTSFLQVFGKHFRTGLPFFPFALKQIEIKEKNALIISISHSVVKGVKFHKSSTHISYLVARNLKYVWEEKELYFTGNKKIFSFIIPYLQKFDIKKSKKATHLISVSNFVSNWVETKYNRKVKTINPPVNIEDFEFNEEKDDFYVSVGRLEPYKRYDVLIDAFNKNGKELIIIGDGSLLEELKQKANKNIKFKGYLFAEKSKEYLKKAKAFVFCGKEDFGIALLEPQVCGTPVITYKAGGALDSVIDNKTGVFYDKQTEGSLNEAITRFEKMDFNPKEIRNHSLGFSINQFKENFDAFVKENTKG